MIISLLLFFSLIYADGDAKGSSSGFHYGLYFICIIFSYPLFSQGALTLQRLSSGRQQSAEGEQSSPSRPSTSSLFFASLIHFIILFLSLLLSLSAHSGFSSLGLLLFIIGLAVSVFTILGQFFDLPQIPFIWEIICGYCLLWLSFLILANIKPYTIILLLIPFVFLFTYILIPPNHGELRRSILFCIAILAVIFFFAFIASVHFIGPSLFFAFFFVVDLLRLEILADAYLTHPAADFLGLFGL